MDKDRKGIGIERKEVFFPANTPKNELPNSYGQFLKDIKTKIKSTRVRTVLKANSEIIILYWEIGKMILEKQNNEGWGAKVIDRLSNDLKDTFPDMKGFSPRNLKYMRAVALAWNDLEFVQRSVAQIPWGSILTIIDKVKDEKARKYYIRKTFEFGWTKPVLFNQIELKLYEREGKLNNNFSRTLPPLESDLAVKVFKDPYIFDFLGNREMRSEAELEKSLTHHVEKFLLELGAGFAFVGRQVHLELGSSDFYLDLLFYHLKLRCFVVVELKAGKLNPGHISQLNMYMNVVDDVMCHSDDNKTIGLLLVKEKNRVVAEYCLKGINKPIGIAEWEQQITESLLDKLKPSLPTIEEIESELSELKKS